MKQRFLATQINKLSKIRLPVPYEAAKSRAEFQILSGWKAIANYLDAGVRSVQRYERELQLPIYRPAGKSRSRVTAIKSELESWAKGRGLPAQLDNRAASLRAQTNRVGAQFLLIDAEIALTLSGLALKANNREKRKRHSDTARQAYETITRLRRNIELNETEREKLDIKLKRLKSDLESLGDRL